MSNSLIQSKLFILANLQSIWLLWAMATCHVGYVDINLILKTRKKKLFSSLEEKRLLNPPLTIVPYIIL